LVPAWNFDVGLELSACICLFALAAWLSGCGGQSCVGEAIFDVTVDDPQGCAYDGQCLSVFPAGMLDDGRHDSTAGG
jgi:hypothetical protein